MKSLYHWLGKQVHAKYGTVLFSFLVFIEGFLLMPVSTLLAFFSLENRPKAFKYALLALLASVFGALAGYLIGIGLWKTGGTAFLSYVISPDKFDELVTRFTEYQAGTTFLLALSPMPFNMLTISAGFMGLPIVPFLLSIVAARGLRFFAISASIYLWGEQFNFYLNEYFYWIIGSGVVGYLLWKTVL